MFQLAVFDMAGTTVNDRDEVYRVLRESVEREGAQFSDETFQKYMGTEKSWAIEQLLRIGGIEPTTATHARAWQWFRDELERTYTSEPPQSIDGVEEMFTQLHNLGIKIALTTGFSREIADLILSSMGWDQELIDTSATGDEVEEGRPAPLLIQKVMADLNIHEPGVVISTGDTQADIISAQRAGVTSVGVLTGHLTEKQFTNLNADFILESAAKIVSIIDN